MLIKTILNKIEKCKSFVYKEQARFEMIHNQEALVIPVKARKNTHGICSIESVPFPPNFYNAKV